MGTNHPHHRHLSSLTNQEISALANLLALPRRILHPTTGVPSVLWLATQECLITSASPPTFPKTLQRPHDILSRLSMSANRCLHLHLDDAIPECAVLCSAHRELNPWIVRRVYRLILQEATGRREVGIVEGYLAKPGRYHCLGLHGEIDGDGTEKMKRTRNSNNVTRLDGSTVSEMRDFVNRMLALVQRSRMGANNSSDGDNDGGAIKIKHHRTQTTSDEPAAELHSTCEACFVATIGADAMALCDLRASLRARAHRRSKKRRRTRTQMKVMAGGRTKRGGEIDMGNEYNNNGSSKSGRSEKSALLRLVDAWIANLSYDEEGEGIGTGRGGQEDVFKESERLAVIVRSVRRAVRKWEKERREGIGLDHDDDHQHQRLHGRYHYISDHEDDHDQKHDGDRNYNDGPGTLTSLVSRRSETTRRHVAAAYANTEEQHDAEWRYSNNALLLSGIDGQLDAWKDEGFGEEYPIISSHCPSSSPGGGGGNGHLDTRQKEESSFWRTGLPVTSPAFVPSWVYEYRRQREHHQQHCHTKSLDTSRTLAEKNEGGDYCENGEKGDYKNKNKNKNKNDDNNVLVQHSEMAGKMPTGHRRISHALSATVSCVDTIDDLLESYHRSEWGAEESDYLLKKCWDDDDDDEDEEDEDDDDDA